MSWSATDSFLFLIAIFIFINPFVVFSLEAISYNDTISTDQVQASTFKDGRIILFIANSLNDTCYEPKINLRVIHPDGAIDLVEVNLENNICGKLRIAALPNNHTLILYENSTDINSASFYASLVDPRAGKLISNTFLSRVSVINGSLSSSGDILPHGNEEYGFLFWSFISENTMRWIYFSRPDSDGKFKPINSNETSSSDRPNIFAGIDGTFAIVTNNYRDIPDKHNATYPVDPTETSLQLFVTFIRPHENGIDGPFLLYQTSIPNLKVVFQCDSAYTSMGYFCILNMKEVKPNGEPKYYLIKLTFQNTGSVVDAEKFSYLGPYQYLSESTRFERLHYGGFLVLFFKNSVDNPYKTFKAIILDDNGVFNSTLDLPENLKAPNHLIMQGSKNNVVAVSQENGYSWKIHKSKYPKFSSYENGYDNPYIQSTYPLINSIIPLSTTNINITYREPITISVNNISIYQYNNENPILRQSVPGSSPFFSRSDDNKTLILNVLESTFNRPNAKYYIVIHDNTVQDWKTNQPLLGIESDIWKFNTIDNQYEFTENAIGRFSLSAEGTKYYESLSHDDDRKEFLSQLRIDLAKSIPVDVDRLDDIRFDKHDNSKQPPKILFKLPIKSTTNKNEPNVDQIIKDLNNLIKEKEITQISWLNTTKHLDATFGFQRTRNLFDEFKFHLIGIAIGIIILGLIYYFAKRRHPKGKNIIIFKNSLIIMDFILDLLFILNNGKNVYQLFVPSIIFCAMPIATNSIMSMIIILREITQNESFYEWFKLNTNIAALFTILAGADLEVLNTLSSQVAGIKLFNAPMSDKSKSYIFWGSFIGFFLEDIPQFIIQVVYVRQIVTYDIIPFLTLLTGSIVLTTNVISRIYVMVHLRTEKRNSPLLPIDQKITFESDMIEKDSDRLTVPQAAKMYYRHSM